MRGSARGGPQQWGFLPRLELGPVMLGDLVPGAMEDVEVPVTLEALAMPFNGWTPHAEVGPGGGSGEHGPGGESGGG